MTRVPGEADAEDYAGGEKVGEKIRDDFFHPSIFSNGWIGERAEFIHFFLVAGKRAGVQEGYRQRKLSTAWCRSA
ncbi:hypothetical protein C7I85_07985 [Mesorhizobium soli]|uniref:Uncharacterized protein n=1 Tax=Pseudaminobacter soli (ex Li et al. 2025) TaxID=1295366 RepID=A0A2P7SIB7_9HYPH|nr:hypothetical protein C7I85_07985 [Mesorhizobium soli]